MRAVIGLFVWLIEPMWVVIKFALNKYMHGYIVAIGYVFMCELQTENVFKFVRNILMVGCGFCAISSKNALSWIP